MLKYLYFAVFSFSLCWSITSVYVVCKGGYQTQVHGWSSGLKCTDSNNHPYRCTKDNCLTADNKPLDSLHYTNCTKASGQPKVLPYVWPTYIFVDTPTHYIVSGSWSPKADGTRIPIGETAGCNVDIKIGLNVGLPACHKCNPIT
ncbi:hypothetical protein O181_060924 [Austropuccinia psidii MF-1]|uniref:Uncharacterized protein n=1 Tax=Austropuccinia psidii MF-1 TaxID=1389203 RepID=A0A9Q3EHA4_9BASI|nr:hypothetical protein [Austropuccinia psidii MF-1]